MGSQITDNQPPIPQRHNPEHPDPQFQHVGQHEEVTPPQPSVADVLIQMEWSQQDQTLILQQIAQNTASVQGAQMAAEGADLYGSRFADFLNTKPPVFSCSEDPLEADDWLRTIERKLIITQCADNEKVLYASNQLEGASSAWWDNLCAMQPVSSVPSWDEFRIAFCEAHVPSSIMSIKRREFLALKQDNKSVLEYLREFNRLARYAPNDVSTDARKQDQFLNGLTEVMQLALAVHDFSDFQQLVNKAIVVENKMQAVVESRKRKKVAQILASCSFQEPHAWQSSPPDFQDLASPVYPMQVFPLPQQEIQLGQPRKKQRNRHKPCMLVACFNCGNRGHFADRCPVKHQVISDQRQDLKTSFDQWSDFTSQNPGRAHVNHVTAEEAQEAPHVVFGTFLVNSTPATVLFDSGASHSFMSRGFATLHNLSLSLMPAPMMIQSPGSEMRSIHECREVEIKIKGVKFSANLIVINSAGLDVILGMNWLSKNLGQIDCARKAITLTSPLGFQVEMVPKLEHPHLYALSGKEFAGFE